VPGYGCWLDVTLIASPCCIDGDVPASGLGLSEDYYAFVLNLTTVQKFPQNLHRTHGNSAQFTYPSHTHTDGILIPAADLSFDSVGLVTQGNFSDRFLTSCRPILSVEDFLIGQYLAEIRTRV